MFWSKKIALTGGPCGGKTSAMNYLHQQFKQWGFTVFMTPEAFTVTAQGHAHELYGMLKQQDINDFCKLGAKITNLCYFFEEYFEDLAKLSKKPTILFCDRGICDTKAYYPELCWNMTLQEVKMNEKQILDRYHAILHLATTAKGAKDHYITSNNMARRESVEEAIEVDDKIFNSWKNHQRLIYVGNENVKSFDEKLNNIQGIVEDLLGLPKYPLQTLKVSVNQEELYKYILSSNQNNYITLEQFDIENEYLNNSFVQKIKQKDGKISYQMGVEMQHPEKPFYLYKQITEKEYNECKKKVPSKLFQQISINGQTLTLQQNIQDQLLQQQQNIPQTILAPKNISLPSFFVVNQ
ncbi:hypothetical protein ABPG72_015492 [Tetrahymena utriculariae]